MTTLAARLSHLSLLPLGGHTMAQHLAAIVARYALPLAAPYTVAAVLVAYSGLPAGLHTVAEHLAVDVAGEIRLATRHERGTETERRQQSDSAERTAEYAASRMATDTIERARSVSEDRAHQPQASRGALHPAARPASSSMSRSNQCDPAPRR